MSENIFIPVYGNTHDIRAKLSENNLGEKYSAMTPIQAILSGKGSHMSFPDGDLESLSEDVCFIISTEQVTDEERDILVTQLNLTPAPISITSEPEESTVLEEMEGQFEDQNVVDIVKFYRFQDTIFRVSQDEDPVGYPMIVRSEGKIINSMINKEDDHTLFLVQIPGIVGSPESGTPTVLPDSESEAVSSFITMGVVYEDDEFHYEKDGEYLFVSEPDSLAFIETMSPCIVTAVGENMDEGTVVVSSWIIEGTYISGASPLVSHEVISAAGMEMIEEYGIDLGSARYVWAPDIATSQLSVLSPVVYGREIVDVCSFLGEQGESEDED